MISSSQTAFPAHVESYGETYTPTILAQRNVSVTTNYTTCDAAAYSPTITAIRNVNVIPTSVSTITDTTVPYVYVEAIPPSVSSTTTAHNPQVTAIRNVDIILEYVTAESTAYRADFSTSNIYYDKGRNVACKTYLPIIKASFTNPDGYYVTRTTTTAHEEQPYAIPTLVLQLLEAESEHIEDPTPKIIAIEEQNPDDDSTTSSTQTINRNINKLKKSTVFPDPEPYIIQR